MYIGTLDGRYAERLADFARRRADLVAGGATREELRALEAEETAYMLDAVPFIREYTDDADEVDQGGAGRAGALDGFVAVTHTTNRNNVLQRYMMHVEKHVNNSTVAAAAAHDTRGQQCEYTCPTCDSPMLFDSRESILVCDVCGKCSTYTEMSANNMTYEQEIHQDVVTHFAYKRLNHFCEWLNSLQAKENTEIPEAVIEAVKAEFKKARAVTRAEIKPTKVREYLKKLKLNKWYEHTNAICNILNGVPPPKLSAELEARLKAMFAEIQEPFERNCPPTRKNFLSYGFTLYKFCELLGEDDLLRCGGVGRACSVIMDTD